MKVKTSTVMLIAAALAVSACVMPAKKQNPNVTKRPTKTSKFLAKNDYYLEDGKTAKKEDNKQTAAKEKKALNTKEIVKEAEKAAAEAVAKAQDAEPKESAANKTKAPTRQEEKKIISEAAKDAEKAVAEIAEEATQEKDEATGTDAEAELMIETEYPMDRHRRRAFSGFTKSPELLEEMEVIAQEPVEPETPLFDEQGLASWYGPGFHGRKTANGEKFNQNAMTAAHRKLPLGTFVEVTNLENGKTIKVRINDRGPYAGKRIIDLSKAAAKELDLLHHGVGKVGIKHVD